jgi:hypothetical protein
VQVQFLDAFEKHVPETQRDDGGHASLAHDLSKVRHPAAYFAHRERPFRAIVSARFGAS